MKSSQQCEKFHWSFHIIEKIHWDVLAFAELVLWLDFTEESANAPREHNFWIGEFKSFIYTVHNNNYTIIIT